MAHSDQADARSWTVWQRSMLTCCVLAMLDAGVLDPTPLVTHHMKLEDAAEAYAVYDRREALKIVMTP